jgi:hypothetical protein
LSPFRFAGFSKLFKTRDFYTRLFVLAIPAMIQNLISALVNILDTISSIPYFCVRLSPLACLPDYHCRGFYEDAVPGNPALQKRQVASQCGKNL